jgi:hypothetical protein
MKNSEKKEYFSMLYFLFKNKRGKQRKDWKIDKVYDPSTKRWIETFYFDKISKYCVKETQLVTDLVPHASGTLLYGASPTVVNSKVLTQKWFKNPFDAAYYFATLVNRVDEIEEHFYQYKDHPEHAEKVSGFKKYFN